MIGGYAVRQDGSWRAVGSPSDIDIDIGEVFVTERPPIPGPTLQDEALLELNRITSASGTFMRCVVAGVPVPAEWSTYALALRAIANGSDTTSTALPAMPTYPQGT